MTSIPLLMTHPHPCSYLAGRSATSLFVKPAFEMNSAIYAELLAHGFRRTGDDVYRPECASCSACVPVRLPVTEFKANRRQKRCLQKNLDTRVRIKPAVFEPSHYRLYLDYQNQRHAEGNMAKLSADEYLSFLGSSWCDTRFVEFFCADQLVAVAVVDFFDNALSAVYTFFDPKFASLSPGVYALLWQIDYAQQHNMDWLYLGFWIADCQKMSYKNQYHPAQGLVNGRWDLLM